MQVRFGIFVYFDSDIAYFFKFKLKPINICSNKGLAERDNYWINIKCQDYVYAKVE